MRIKEVTPNSDFTLTIVTVDGHRGIFDVKPYFQYPVFQDLKDFAEFQKTFNGGYFIEWECGADLSADSIEAHWKEFSN